LALSSFYGHGSVTVARVADFVELTPVRILLFLAVRYFHIEVPNLTLGGIRWRAHPFEFFHEILVHLSFNLILLAFLYGSEFWSIHVSCTTLRTPSV